MFKKIRFLVCVMSSTESGESWSQWIDFDKSNVSSIPECAGVFGMHEDPLYWKYSKPQKFIT